ncbi:protein of unknown function [uncultured Sphingopyxis sp.]|uniref:Uncharacterized protein n=1 Tax=uncultured Sphingopyxis sp. TaxID=310581 RepID=A0A1Y5PWI7_9SPHN|nr:protein of unknown function [uncultured Sphingopyxis sp.]
MQCRQDARSPGAPVAPPDDRPFDAQRVEKVERIHRERRLLTVSGRRVRQETRRAIAAQVGHQNAIALRPEHKRRIGVGMYIVWPTMDEQHRRAVCRPHLGISDIEQAGADMLQQSEARGRRRGRTPRRGEQHRRRRPCQCLRHEAASIGVLKSGHCIVSYVVSGNEQLAGAPAVFHVGMGRRVDEGLDCAISLRSFPSIMPWNRCADRSARRAIQRLPVASNVRKRRSTHLYSPASAILEISISRTGVSGSHKG